MTKGPKGGPPLSTTKSLSGATTHAEKPHPSSGHPKLDLGSLPSRPSFEGMLMDFRGCQGNDYLSPNERHSPRKGR